MPSRRDVLAGSGALVGSAALAGCSGILGGGEEDPEDVDDEDPEDVGDEDPEDVDDEAPAYVDWIPAREEPVVDFAAYRPADVRSVDDVPDTAFQTLEADLAPVSVADVEQVVDFWLTTVIEGDFEAAEMREAVVESDDTVTARGESYGGFERYAAGERDEEYGIRDGTVLATPPEQFETTVDAHEGDADRLVEQRDDFERVTREFGTAELVSGTVRFDSEARTTRFDDGEVASARRLAVSEGDSEGAMLLLFEAADDVDEAAVSRLIEDDDRRTLGEVSVDGRLARASYTIATADLQL